MGAIRTRIRVLGPLEAVQDGRALALGGPRPRAVLSALVLGAGRPVGMHALVDAVWGDDPPETAVKTVQKYVSHLRAGLADPGLIVSRADGYELGPVDTDARRFEELIGGPRDVERLTEALRLWRGEPYADLPELAVAQAERLRLTELRLGALEALADARLALGQHDRIVGWLEELVAEHPLRERLWAALMLALYRGGRQADALTAYRRLRTVLVEEVGVEPTPELRDLHARILRQPDGPVAPSLPLRLTSFVGRETELDAIGRTLARARVVTLTGPAGSGKTRLALELLAQSAGAAWFVELAGVDEPARLVPTIAGALRLGDQAGRDPADVLTENLADRHGLLVLDNCEHLLDSVAPLVAQVLRNADGVRILATSRQPLGVSGEFVCEVPPLRVPPGDELAGVAAAEAVRLLVDRAATVTPGFAVTPGNAAALARIARRLDGLPLALELAAARLRVFDAARLADLLDDRFHVLVSTLRTAPARHQTLRAAVAWSYDALDAEEQTLFRALCVFEAGFGIEAAEEVGGEPAIALLPTLVERSLVGVDRQAETVRYGLLETLREYGRGQLDPDEADALHRRHLAYHLRLAEQAQPRLNGPDQRTWMDRLAAAWHDLRAALRWALARGEHTAALRLATALVGYWDRRGQFSEGTVWLREAIDATERGPAKLRVAALAGAAVLAIRRSDHDEAITFATASLELAGTIGDERDVAHATWLLGCLALYQGDYARARPLLTAAAAAFERLDRPADRAEAIGRLGHLSRLTGEHATARSYLEDAARLSERAGDVTGLAWSTWQLGVVARYEGDYTAAEGHYQRSLARYEAVGDADGAAHVRYSLGDLARLRGDSVRATDLYTAALGQLREFGDLRCVASLLFNLATLTSDQVLLARSLELRRHMRDRAGIAECLEASAGFEESAGDAVSAVRLLGAADALRKRTGAARPASDDAAQAARVQRLRTTLGADAFDAVWAAGAADNEVARWMP